MAAQIAQLERQILDVFEGDHPQSVQHCFYRLTDPRLPEHVEKSERGYRQIQQRFVEMRRGVASPSAGSRTRRAVGSTSEPSRTAAS